jgi:hypothetical protein
MKIFKQMKSGEANKNITYGKDCPAQQTNAGFSSPMQYSSCISWRGL